MIVDLPLRRPHVHSASAHVGQSVVLVTIRTRGGGLGIGEGGTPSGTAFWGGESSETIKLMIDRYLAPAIMGGSAVAHESLMAAMDTVAPGNHFAKAAIDVALHDLVGRGFGVPASFFYGGRVRDTIPVVWALASGDFEADAVEACRLLDERRHRSFKIKIGRCDPKAETRRAVKTAEAIRAHEPAATFSVDLNGAWDEPTATLLLPWLEDAGFALVEQPVASWNLPAMSRLAARLRIPIMADESLWDNHDAFDAAARGFTDVFAVKVAKAGGIRRAYKAAAVAEAAGLPLYGGMALESSLGTAASLQLFSALGDLRWGCESIGPRLMADDLTAEPVAYRDYEVVVPDGDGLGLKLDPDKVARYRRQ